MMQIVFVDDDPRVLEGLRRMLFGRREVWAMRFFSDPRQALSSLDEAPADLAVSDLQIPEMDGVAFLEQVRQRFPETIRYVLTGVLDHPRLPQAMRCAHQVLAKPCRPQALCEVIERAEKIKAKLTAIKKVSLFSDLNNFPVMPETHRKVLDMLASPSASPRRLGQLVAEDIGMSARIVQLANSPWFGRSGRIHDPVQAVLFLGIKTVEAMVLTEGLFARLSPELVQMFGVAGLQSHCLRVSSLARKISADLQMAAERIEAASTAGILHDAGKIVLMSRAEALYLQALQRSRSEGRFLYDVEQELIGVSHGELAGAMLQLWDTPADIIEAAACHHHPQDATSAIQADAKATLADIIHLADAIDHAYCSSGADGASVQMDITRLSRLGLAEAAQDWTRRHIEICSKEPCYEHQHV